MTSGVAKSTREASRASRAGALCARILVTDSDTERARIFADVLSSLGARVECAPTPEQESAA